jgi:hypothetical protein
MQSSRATRKIALLVKQPLFLVIYNFTKEISSTKRQLESKSIRYFTVAIPPPSFFHARLAFPPSGGRVFCSVADAIYNFDSEVTSERVSKCHVYRRRGKYKPYFWIRYARATPRRYVLAFTRNDVTVCSTFDSFQLTI